MDKIVVVGGKKLNGEVVASGAKNAALPIIFSSLLGEGKHVFNNVPGLRDIDSSCLLMNSLGCKSEFKFNQLTIDVGANTETHAHYDIVRKMRASILVLGPLLARFGVAEVSLPGGCAIGARPINMHLEALEKMGALIEIKNGYVIAKTKKLQGAKVPLPFASVGATENTMMAATLADGETFIENAAKEPEIVDLANYLNAMGAKVEGAGTSTIKITGVDKLKAAEHSIMPDRIEAGTLLVAGAMTGGSMTVKDCAPKDLTAFTNKLSEMGVKVSADSQSISIHCENGLKPVKVITEPYPGFPTDLQAQIMTLSTQAEGVSEVLENVFENRFMHVPELVRMNAKIDIDGKKAVITGTPGGLIGAPVMATDLRASASLVLAGLVAQGETVVNRIYHLDRGYEKLEEKLTILGGQVRRIKG